MNFSFSIYKCDILFMSANLSKFIVDKRPEDIQDAFLKSYEIL